MKYRLSAALLAAALFIGLFAGCAKTPAGNKNYVFDDETVLSGLHYVVVQIESYGNFVIEVDADSAPKTATFFLRAVNEGAYNKTTVSVGLQDVVFGGGYNEEYERTVEGEFADNGFENPIEPASGVIYLMHGSDYNSAGTGFFVQLDGDESYRGKFAAFGRIVEGYSVLTTITDSSICNSSYGTIPESFQPVISEMLILDDYTPSK